MCISVSVCLSLARFISFDVAGATATEADDVNAVGDITGIYFDTSGVEHGFLRSANVFDVPHSTSLTGLRINDDATVTGVAHDSLGHTRGFVYASGKARHFRVGRGDTAALDINNLGAVVGTFATDNDDEDSFIRSADGKTRKFAISGPVIATVSTCINDNGAVAGGALDDSIVGNFADSGGVTHGFVRAPDGSIMTLDYPGSKATSPNLINDQGEIVGYHADSSGGHGFIYFP